MPHRLVSTSASATTWASPSGTPVARRQAAAHCATCACGTCVMPVAAEASTRRPRDHALLLLAQAGDAQRDAVSRLQVALRLLAHADARRGSGRDDVARQQRHELADV